MQLSCAQLNCTQPKPASYTEPTAGAANAESTAGAANTESTAGAANTGPTGSATYAESRGGAAYAGSRARASKMKFGLRNVSPLLPLTTEIDSVLLPVFRALAGMVKV